LLAAQIFESDGGSLKNVDRETAQSALDHTSVSGFLTCAKFGATPALPTATKIAKIDCHQISRSNNTPLGHQEELAFERRQLSAHTALCVARDFTALLNRGPVSGNAMWHTASLDVRGCRARATTSEMDSLLIA